MLHINSPTSSTTSVFVPIFPSLEENDALVSHGLFSEFLASKLESILSSSGILASDFYKLFIGLPAKETASHLGSFAKLTANVEPIDVENLFSSLEATVASVENYISVNDAIHRQMAIHHKLMAEIDEGLEMEAQYLKYYDMGEE
ncbi:MAG: hypothetical protein IPO91_08740 [Chloroflexi bacterium]|nr:hypothetical protein [Chloroflexota bacterium]